MAEMPTPAEVKPTVVAPEEATETVQLSKAELESLKAEAASAAEAKTNLDKVVSELIELRKKKSVSPEEKEKLELENKSLREEVIKAKTLRNDAVITSFAVTPAADPTPKAGEKTLLTPEQNKLREEKGWTEEKYLQMKARHPKIIL